MKKEEMTKLGEKLKKAREKSSYTQEEVGEILGLGRDAILRIEKGTRNITAKELHSLAQLYSIDMDGILNSDNGIDINLKGIILAGGLGTRLYPITKGISKQLIPVYDKPMIYYPLEVLMQAKIRDILIITTKEDQVFFKKMLKDGKQFGINLTYEVQDEPKGIAQAFTIGEKFISDSPCALILGDNIFYGNGLSKELKQASINAKNGMATIFGYQVKDPERFGIMELDGKNNVISVEEKPKIPKSDYAITGLYFYPQGVSKKARKIKCSNRGEYEITTLNDMYLKENHLKARLLGEGYSWFDTGTFDSLLDASNMIKTIETNRDAVICCPEKTAYENGWIDENMLEGLACEHEKNSYGKFLRKVLSEKNEDNRN